MAKNIKTLSLTVDIPVLYDLIKLKSLTLVPQETPIVYRL